MLDDHFASLCLSLSLSLPLELFTSLSLIFQYGGRSPLSPQSPSYLLISVPNQFPNLHLKIRPRIPDNRVFIRIFETCALPLNALSTILSLYYDSLLFFLFFLVIFHFSIHHECTIRTCFSRSTGLSQRNSDTRWGYK